MSTVSITTYTRPAIKEKAKKLAKKEGLSVSGLVNRMLEEVIIDTNPGAKLSEEPTPYLLKSIKQGRKAFKEGKSSPIFHTAREGIEYLHK